VIVGARRDYYPVSQSVSVDGRGRASVFGGWATLPGGAASVDVGTQWVFARVRRGIGLSFTSRSNARYRFEVWFEPHARVRFERGAMRVAEPDGTVQRYVFNRPFTHAPAGVYHSAYAPRLESVAFTVAAHRGDVVRYAVEFAAPA
jgi:hypothetical protein